jgi:hypothetical protein
MLEIYLLDTQDALLDYSVEPVSLTVVEAVTLVQRPQCFHLRDGPRFGDVSIAATPQYGRDWWVRSLSC